ncbi:MAG: response regulator [Gemmatimonadetes bacterium]|nr:MAG: response regulator [Gemmatimonadota bacterium]
MSETAKKRTVLLVDDDAFIRDFLKMLLEYLEFEVEMAENGQEGVDKAQKTPFDLIVSDIDMPVMNGLELISAIRRFNEDVPIVILTGNDDVSTAIEAMRKGAFDYIFKDDNIQEALPIAVDKALEKRRLEEENKRLLIDLQQKNADLEETNRMNVQLLERIQAFNEELQEKIAAATSELRVTNQLLNLKVEELNALHAVGQAISSIVPMDKLLNLIMERSKFLMKAEASSLAIINPDTNELEFQVAQGDAGDIMRKIRVPVDENSIAGWVAKHQKPLVIEDAYTDKRFNPEYDKKTGFRTKSIMCVPLLAKNKVIGIVQVINKLNDSTFNEVDLEVFDTFSHQASIAIENARLYEALEKKANELRETLERERRIAIEKEKMGKFIPKTVLDEIRKSREEHLALGGRPVTATVLFSDIAGFTRISETQKPEVIVSYLNHYMTAMTHIIESHQGIVDKFMGDGIMAVFSPTDGDDHHADHAVQASIEMQQASRQLSKEWVKSGLGALSMRIGLNTGNMVAGNIGSETRMDYTVIGDNVNLASRLETACPPGGVLMSETTFAHLTQTFPTKKIDPIHVKNRVQPVQPYLIPSETIESL